VVGVVGLEVVELEVVFRGSLIGVVVPRFGEAKQTG